MLQKNSSQINLKTDFFTLKRHVEATLALRTFCCQIISVIGIIIAQHVRVVMKASHSWWKSQLMSSCCVFVHANEHFFFNNMEMLFICSTSMFIAHVCNFGLKIKKFSKIKSNKTSDKFACDASQDDKKNFVLQYFIVSSFHNSLCLECAINFNYFWYATEPSLSIFLHPYKCHSFSLLVLQLMWKMRKNVKCSRQQLWFNIL